MQLPELKNWDKTRTALHQGLASLQLARLVSLDPLPNALRHSVIPTPTGARTGQLKFGGELSLDYTQLRLTCIENDQETLSVSLAGHSQKSFVQQIFDTLSHAGHDLQPDLSHASDDTPFEIDAAQAATYAAVQWRMFIALAELKAHFFGSQTPLVLWPHGFDLSTLWFAGGMDEHKDAHINFGFSPGTPDVGQPYIYFYAWPLPDGLSGQLPDAVQWHTDWSTPGGLITYDHFASKDEPESWVVKTLLEVYETTSTRLKT